MEADINVQGSPMDQQEEAHYRCSFCAKCQHQVRKLIAGPNGVYICDGCILICVDVIEEASEEEGHSAFRHCLVPVDEPRYYDLKQQSEEQKMLLEAAEPVIPEQYTALRESIAGVLRPPPVEPTRPPRKRKASEKRKRAR